jgi:uncharacterized protein YndB with AHSA1/START domain
MDVRLGGKYRWRWHSDEEGQEFGFFGTFTEVREPARLSYDQYYDPGNFDSAMPLDDPAKIRSTYTEENGITTLVTVMDFGSREARDAAISTGMTDGMEVSYQQLDALVASEQAKLSAQR